MCGRTNASYFLRLRNTRRCRWSRLLAKYYQRLPENYISKEDALDSGWIPGKGNFNEIFPGKAVGGSVYFNRNGHLPSSAGRIWYEADINYSGGFRGADRILYSNDGLIFVTYDHYESFVEIV